MRRLVLHLLDEATDEEIEVLTEFARPYVSKIDFHEPDKTLSSREWKEMYGRSNSNPLPKSGA